MRPPNSSAASMITIGAASIAPITTRAHRCGRIDQNRADCMREFAGFAAALDITPMRRCRHRRNMDGFDDFAGTQRGFQRADDEILDCDRAHAGSASQRQFRAQRRERGNPVRRGIGMAERSADRAAVADRAVGDVGGDGPHGAARDVGNAAVFDVGVGDAGAEHEFVAAMRRPASVRQARRCRRSIPARPAAD